ncbi:MAG: hypothetical protein H6P99_2895 [Holophagaceae bacterium]|nr:hypothetical protein [Holophagaceae bacterium]
MAGWPAVVKGPLSEDQRQLAGNVWGRYVRYKEAYFADGWPIAEAPRIEAPQPGFAEGHPYP